jgi:hypothetical protein
MTIDRFFFIIIIAFLSLKTNAQNNRISIFYGFARNELFRSDDLDGSASFNGKGSDIYGITYQRYLSDHFSLETGLEYSKNKIEITPAYYPETHMYVGNVQQVRSVNIEMFTIPVYVNYTFLEYFFVNGGALIDFEINRDEYESPDKQSGIGFGAGIGVQYTLQHFKFFINPMLRFHAVIPFERENYQQHLVETGVKLGIGYNF